MKKVINILILLIFAVSILVSCTDIPSDISSQPSVFLTEYNINPLNYYSVYCSDAQASTKISVKDGKVYCKYIKDGQNTIDVIENIEKSLDWTNVSKPDKINTELSYSDSYKYPLNQKIGNCKIYTDDKNDFYITDTTADISYDLGLNLENWRAFATDNIDTFAVLSSEGISHNNEFIYEIRVYKIITNPSDSNYYNNSLLLTVGGGDNLNNIEKVTVLSGTCATGALELTDKKDLEFLENYTYSHFRHTTKDYESYLLQDKSDYCLEVSGGYISSHLYVLQDGSIAIKQMCGDSEVPDVIYEIFTTNKEDMLTKEYLDNFKY